MSRFVFTTKPPENWQKLCSYNEDFFNAVAWQDMLYRSFNCSTIYGWDCAASNGLTITVFKIGPFRVGYIGFPVGSTVNDFSFDLDVVATLKRATFPVVIHLLRLPVSAFRGNIDLPLPAIVIPETAIENLQDWCFSNLSHNLKKMVNRAKRSPLKIVDADDSFQGEKLFGLYRDTMKAHNGNMRYAKKYFCELIELAKSNSDLRCFLAKVDNDIAGFLVVACQKKTLRYILRS